MTLPRSLVLALALMAGVAGALVARAVPGDHEPTIGPVSSPSPAQSQAAPACEAQRAELSSARLKLALCLTMHTQSPSVQPELSAPAASDPHEFESPDIKRNRELLEGDSEAVIVRRPDGTIGFYASDEWPSNGDGIILGRKFSDGSIGWYSRPHAGAGGRAMFRGSSIEIEPDGRITVRGKRAPPWVMRMLGEPESAPDAN